MAQLAWDFSQERDVLSTEVKLDQLKIAESKEADEDTDIL